MTVKRPNTLKGDLARLPIALTPLTGLHHWVLWRWEFRRGVWTKPPYTTTGGRAKNNDPATWAPYESALAAVQNDGSFDGIGFALLDTPFDVVDLDHCLDPVTAQIDEWARTWIDAANGAYVERTPSGEGLRIISGMGGTEKLHRKWPIKGARQGAAVEVYRNCERYITVTGIQVGDCDELGSANGLLEQIREGMERAGKHSGASGTRFDFNQAGSKIDFDDVIENGAPNGADVSALFHSVVGHLYSKGMSVDEIVETLSKPIHGIGRRYPGRLRQEVERSFEKWTAKARITPDAAPDATEPEEKLEWDRLDRKGRPIRNRTNTRRALLAMEIKASYDSFHDKYLIRDKDSSSTDLKIIALEISKKLSLAYKFEPSVATVEEALLQIAHANSFNPIVDYLAKLKWDGKPRLERWLIDYLGAEDTELVRAFGRLALVAAVRRVRHPGSKFDPIIVFEGAMGTQKSMSIETMAGSENFSDQTILGVRDKEAQELTAGIWLYEIADLAGIRRAEVEHVKAFASRTCDRARPAYGHSRVDRPRTCIFFATTNDQQYLKETDRRFWPVRTSAIDIKALRHDRDQLWAEAAQQEREGASIVLDPKLRGSARVEQQKREESDPWDEGLAGVVGTVEQGEERVSTIDLLTLVLGFHISKQYDTHYKRLGRCMRRLGWDGPRTVRIGNKNLKGYSRKVS
jgi:hypothetical protein